MSLHLLFKVNTMEFCALHSKTKISLYYKFVLRLHSKSNIHGTMTLPNHKLNLNDYTDLNFFIKINYIHYLSYDLQISSIWDYIYQRSFLLSLTNQFFIYI